MICTHISGVFIVDCWSRFTSCRRQWINSDNLLNNVRKLEAWSCCWQTNISQSYCLHCFDTSSWALGRASSLWKIEWWGLAWLSVWSEVPLICICHLIHYHPIISCFIKIHTGLTFLMPAYPGCPRKEAIKWLSEFLFCYLYCLWNVKPCFLKEKVILLLFCTSSVTLELFLIVPHA